jgi:hypothetical protein
LSHYLPVRHPRVFLSGVQRVMMPLTSIAVAPDLTRGPDREEDVDRPAVIPAIFWRESRNFVCISPLPAPVAGL